MKLLRKRALLKCRRYGHKYKRKTWKGYQWPGEGYRSVADFVTAWMLQCTRCHHIHRKKRGVIYRESIQELELPSSDWEKLRRTGILRRS